MPNGTDEGEQRRRAELVHTLGEPFGAEVAICTLLSRWLSDLEVGVLCRWIARRGGSEPQ